MTGVRIPVGALFHDQTASDGERVWSQDTETGFEQTRRNASDRLSEFESPSEHFSETNP